MEFTTEITNALSNGAIAAASGMASTLVTDLYAGAKAIIAGRFKRGRVVEALEEDPSSDAQKAAVSEALTKSGASGDPELLELVRKLTAALAEIEAPSAKAMGLDIENLRAANVTLSDISASSTAVRMRQVDVSGDINVSNIRAGQEPSLKN